MASSSSRPAGSSTLPTDKPLALLPLDPRPATKAGSVPIVYTVKLSDDVVDALLSAENPSIQFDSETNGVVCIRNANDEIKFTAHPLNDADSKTGHAACLSRRGDCLRTVGPIVAHLDLDHHQLSKSISSGSRKRTLPPTHSNRREVKIIDDDYTQSSKRPRVEKQAAIGKRPRPGPRRSSLTSKVPRSQPQTLTTTPKPLSTSKPLTKPTSQPHIAPPSLSTPRPHTGGKTLTLPFAYRSALRSAPSTVRSPIAPKTPPTARAANMGGSLPRPLSGQTSRSQAVPFLFRSVPPPSTAPTNATNNRSSQPGVCSVANGGVTKGKSQSRGSFSGLKRRTVPPTAAKPPVFPHPIRRTGYKPGKDVKGSGKPDEHSDVMPFEKLEERLNLFEKEEGDVKLLEATNGKNEVELRRRFSKWYPVYSAIIGEMRSMKKVFSNLETRFNDCSSDRDRDGVVKEIHSSHQKLRGRKQRLEKTLPVMHALLKDIKKVLNEYAKDRA